MDDRLGCETKKGTNSVMKFTSVEVKRVMQKTSCGEWDCQRALAMKDGDVDAAIRFLYESSSVILEGVQICDWWRVADEQLFTPQQYEQVLRETGADEFTCERALAESKGNVYQAIKLAKRYLKDAQQ